MSFNFESILQVPVSFKHNSNAEVLQSGVILCTQIQIWKFAHLTGPSKLTGLVRLNHLFELCIVVMLHIRASIRC